MSLNRVVAQVGGDCLSIPAEAFRQATIDSPALLDLTLRHVQGVLAQTEQGVACNALHEVEQRLCRWLLMTQDRMVGTGEVVPLTHEFLALMLGIPPHHGHGGGPLAAAAGADRIRPPARSASWTGRDWEQGACECYESLRRNLRLLS